MPPLFASMQHPPLILAAAPVARRPASSADAAWPRRRGGVKRAVAVGTLMVALAAEAWIVRLPTPGTEDAVSALTPALIEIVSLPVWMAGPFGLGEGP